jgi:hypothetical protein
MLPKLQQSSLAQSLRRDNPASHLQCTCDTIQARISSSASSASKAMKLTSHGKTSMRPRTRILPSEISPRNTSQKTESKQPNTNPSMKQPYPDHLPSTPEGPATVARPPAHSRRSHNIKNQYPYQGLSRSATSPPQSSEGTTTEEICQSE